MWAEKSSITRHSQIFNFTTKENSLKTSCRGLLRVLYFENYPKHSQREFASQFKRTLNLNLPSHIFSISFPTGECFCYD